MVGRILIKLLDRVHHGGETNVVGPTNVCEVMVGTIMLKLLNRVHHGGETDVVLTLMK